MRTAHVRWAAAGVPLALFAVTACGGPEESGAPSPADEPSISSIDESSREAASSGAARASGELASRGGESRGSGAVGESAGQGRGRPTPTWPEDDVTGSVPRGGPGAGRAGTAREDAVPLTYDTSAADGYAGAVHAAAEAWNEKVPEIELRRAPAGSTPDIRIVTSDGWPGAGPAGPAPGKGTVIVGRRALAAGYDGIRIVAHELGHLLGLQDAQPGPCTSLMSGKSAGAPCTNASPDPAEVREVRRNFGPRSAATR